MPSRSEQARRKALLQGIAAQRQAQAVAALPLPLEALRALFDHLDDALGAGCDHSLRFTTQFLQQQVLDEQAVIPWLRDHGGYCDCEVLANVEDAWQ